MTAVVITSYFAIAYYYFHLILRHLQPHDTPFTAVVNVTLALTIGPLLLIPAMILGHLQRIMAVYNN